jgi:hypothetical protein
VIVLISFPFLYRDELLYSVLARYHQYSGNENPKHTVNEAFGSKTVCASTTFPANLKLLCNRVSNLNTYGPSYFIDKHTLLPYFAPFISKERYFELRRVMSEEGGSSLYMKLGKVASTIKSNNYLNYCKECVAEENAVNGEVYWHRTHQVEGVRICPAHKTGLLKSNIPFSERKHKHEFISLQSIINVMEPVNVLFTKIEFDHYLYIAEQTYYLLNNKIEPLGSNNIRRYYVTKLQEKGLISVGGRVRWKELISLFNHFYGTELLQNLNCYINYDKEDTWIQKLLRKPRVSSHPLRHILFLGFLGETISSMVSQINTISYKPFGSGPWICLNKAAEHYQKPVITSCEITRDYKSGLPLGTFSCSCGFVFSRKGPDKTDIDKYKIGRIKEFGSVWESKFAELARQKLSLRKMGEKLGVDPMTIKKKLSINVNDKQSNNYFEEEEKKQNYRNQWFNLMKINEGASVTEIRLQNQKVYMWLYRNDKDWLEINAPIIQKGNKIHSVLRVDWEKRDHEMAAKVESIVSNILKEKAPLIKVTKNEIGRRLGKLSSFIKNLDNFPRTLRIVNQSLESIEQFQVRRVKYAVEEMRKTNDSIKEWQVIRAAGLKKEHAVNLRQVIIKEIYD